VRPMRRIPQVVVLITLTILLLVSVALAQTGNGFDLTWFTVDGGGSTSSGGPYVLSGTIGQSDAGGLSGGSYMLVGGFWSAFTEKPTAIDLLSFAAEAGADHVMLAWETSTEVDNAGFNLWRSEATDGPYAKVNDVLIPAEGDAVSGASYTYDDTDVVQGVTYYYKLEDVDVRGVSTFHGPVSATPGHIHRIYLPLVLKQQDER